MAAMGASRDLGLLLVRARAILGGCALLARVHLVLRQSLLIKIELRTVLASNQLLYLLQTGDVELTWHHGDRGLLLIDTLLARNCYRTLRIRVLLIRATLEMRMQMAHGALVDIMLRHLLLGAAKGIWLVALLVLTQFLIGRVAVKHADADVRVERRSKLLSLRRGLGRLGLAGLGADHS